MNPLFRDDNSTTNEGHLFSSEDINAIFSESESLCTREQTNQGYLTQGAIDLLQRIGDEFASNLVIASVRKNFNDAPIKAKTVRITVDDVLEGAAGYKELKIAVSDTGERGDYATLASVKDLKYNIHPQLLDH